MGGFEGGAIACVRLGTECFGLGSAMASAEEACRGMGAAREREKRLAEELAELREELMDQKSRCEGALSEVGEGVRVAAAAAAKAEWEVGAAEGRWAAQSMRIDSKVEGFQRVLGERDAKIDGFRRELVGLRERVENLEDAVEGGGVVEGGRHGVVTKEEVKGLFEGEVITAQRLTTLERLVGESIELAEQARGSADGGREEGMTMFEGMNRKIESLQSLGEDREISAREAIKGLKDAQRDLKRRVEELSDLMVGGESGGGGLRGELKAEVEALFRGEVALVSRVRVLEQTAGLEEGGGGGGGGGGTG